VGVIVAVNVGVRVIEGVIVFVAVGIDVVSVTGNCVIRAAAKVPVGVGVVCGVPLISGA
jgi:hypothetical protein